MSFSSINLSRSGFFIVPVLFSFTFGGRSSLGISLYFLWTFFILSRFQTNVEFYGTKLDRPLLCFLFAALLSAIYSLIANHTGFIYLLTLLCHAVCFYIFLAIKDEFLVAKYLKFLKTIALGFGLLLLIFLITRTDVKKIFPNENLLSAFLNCGLLISLAQFRGNINFVANLLSILILSLAQISLASRGGTLALLLTLALFFVSDWKKALPSLKMILAILILTLLIWPSLFGSIFDSFFSNPLGYSRIHIWKGAMLAFLDRPLFGWGLGNFGRAYLLHRLPIEAELGRFEKTTSFAHNEFLDVLVQMGIAGLILYAWLIGTILYFAIASLRHSKEDWKSVAASLSLLSLIFHSVFDFVFHLPLLSFLLFTLAALVVGNKEEKIEFKNVAWLKKITVPAMGICALAIASLLLTKISFYQWAHKLNPFDNVPMEKMAASTVGEERIYWLKKETKLLKYRDDLYEKLAREEMLMGNVPEAIAALKEAINLNPKFPFHYSELAEIYLAHGISSPAKELYKTSIRLEPLYQEAHFRLGYLYLQEGKKEEAKREFQNILKIESVKIKSDSPYVRRLFDFNPNQAKEMLAKISSR